MDTTQFYERLDELLEERDWKVYRLAKEADMSSQTIYNMRRRRSEPKLETFLKIVDGFHISLDEFVYSGQERETITHLQYELVHKCKDFSVSKMHRMMAYADGMADEIEEEE